MIRYLTYAEIDKHKWDNCIDNSFNGIIYAYSWYLDVVCPGWEALVEDDYQRIFPLTSRKKCSINYLFQPVFSQQLGIFSKSKLNENNIEEFITKIPSKYKFAEINLNIFNKINPLKYNVVTNFTHELDLITSYETHYRNYSDNAKRNLKHASDANLIIVKNISVAEIIEIFTQNKGKEIKTLKEKDYNILKKLVSICLNKKVAYLWGVKTKENKLCAGAVFVESNKKVIFLFSAISMEARINGAMSFLIDNFIKENSQRNLTLDFEGSNNSNLARFYKSFGSKECVYLGYKNNDLPWILSKSVTFIKWIKKYFEL